MPSYVGGPCAGRQVPALASGVVSCGGSVYFLGLDGNYHLSDVATTGNVAGEAHRGWGELRRQVNQTLPTRLSRAAAILRAAERDLRRMGG